MLKFIIHLEHYLPNTYICKQKLEIKYMKKVILLSLCAFVFFCQCKKNEIGEETIVKMYFKETKCSNPWEVLPENNNYLTEVKNFLEENGITVNFIEIKKISTPPVYGGCSVLSGRRINIETTEPSIDKAKIIGFLLIE